MERLRAFRRWYWFHVKRALWNWNCKDLSCKRQMQELWSFLIVFVIYKAVFLVVLGLVVLCYWLA